MSNDTPKYKLILILLAVVNALPIIGVLGGIWSMHQVGFFYWSESLLLAFFALSAYARYLLIFMAISALVAALVYITEPFFLNFYKMTALYWAIYSICVLIYIEVTRSTYGVTIRKLPTKHKLGVYAAFLLVSICFTVFLTSFLYPYLGDVPLVEFDYYRVLIVASIIVPSISMAMLKMISMIGEKHFIDFLLGTYHTPVESESIVVFLDMVGSSAMAEKLSPQKSMDLIARFIYDCSYLFRIHGGDILNYTGDGLVATWPSTDSHQALSAMYALRKHFATRDIKKAYWKRFGRVPDFRVGVHVGPVVISQIGEEKLFLGLYGDTVNTAARLEQMNKELGTKILVSEPVIVNAGQTWKTVLKPLGEKEIRGRKGHVRVYTILSEV